MAARALNLMVGAGFQLEPLGGKACYLVELIGYATGRSLLISPPREEDGRIAVKEGDEVAIRYLGGDNSYAFHSRVLRICAEPYPYLHLEYPVGVQGASTRRGMRYPVDGPVLSLAMQDRGREIRVIMADISVNGARLVSPARLGEIGDSFSIEMPDIAQSAEEPLVLPCRIRHMRAQIGMEGGVGTMYHHGVEFDRLEAAAQLFIARFIQDSIMRRRGAG